MADGEFVYAHAQERFGQCQVCTKFAADADPDAGFMTVFDGHLDELEDSRMMGIEEGIELGLLTVDGQGVLRQVIRTDAEEVYFFSQFFTHDGSGRRFDHDADFHVLIIGNTFFIQFLTDFIEDFFAPLYFPDGMIIGNMMAILP